MSPFEVLAVGLLGLAAVFAGGLLVGGILGRLELTADLAAADRGGDPPRKSIRNAGRYIGWLERGLIFAVIVAGMPSAAALVLGIKTAARFPQFEHEERFVEYYLIGTLLSLSVALAAALIARALLDLPLLAG
jgi:hypothetical protein